MLRSRKTLLALLSFLVLISLIAVSFGIYSYRRPLPKTEGAIRIMGLGEAVTVYRDEWGIPQIYASSPHDLFLTQGYIHAQDRWWQMEMYRHIGRGRLSLLLKDDEDALNLDRFSRAVGWNRIARMNWHAASAESRAALEAYALGVNAYLQERDPGELAMEYTLLDVTGRDINIKAWEPVDSLAVMVVLAWMGDDSFAEEFSRLRLTMTLDPDLLEGYLPPYQPGENTIIPAEDLPFLDDGAMPVLPPIMPEGVTYERINMRLAGGLDPAKMPVLDRFAGGTAWVVNGSMTASGKPLLFGSISMNLSLPSLWYGNGLYCLEPGCPYTVGGYSIPGIPAVVAGHNATFAWTITGAEIDSQDIYLITLNPDRRDQYEYNGTWRDMEVISEIMGFEDGSPVTWKVYRTAFGPIISDLTVSRTRQAMALRWTGMESGDPLAGLLALNRANDLASFRAALGQWDWSAFHILYADVNDNIGYRMVGRAPLRAPDHNGKLPVPGRDDSLLWRGFIPPELLPGQENPERGWIIAAGQETVSPAYGTWLVEQIGTDANAFFMTQNGIQDAAAGRIEALLTRSDVHTVDSFGNIQSDTASPFAGQLLALIDDLDFSAAPKLEEYRVWLAGWDGHFEDESPYPVLAAMFWSALVESAFDDQLPAPAEGLFRERFAIGNLTPDHAWWDDLRTPSLVESRDDTIYNAFESAVRSAEDRFGTGRESWRWGNLHNAIFATRSPGESSLEELIAPDGIPTGGDFGAINPITWQTLPETRYQVATAPAFRLIVDLGNFENSRGILSTGQSGHPASEHYTDMIDLWRGDQYHGLYWERDTFQERAVSTLRLRPGN